MIGTAGSGETRLTINASDRIESLDGLRGIAILLVFVCHYVPSDRTDALSAVTRLGWIGVDLFFVLSGFLITGVLVDTRDCANRFKSFYVRRALRLFPVYCLAVAVVIIGTHFLRGFRGWINFPLFFYGSNLVALVPENDLTFPPYFDCKHFWSLALEEQFYTIWPFVVFFVPGRRAILRVCVVGVVAALVFRLAASYFGWSPWVSYLELPMRMDGLLLGSLIALVVRDPNPHTWLRRGRLNWIFLVSFGVFVVSAAITRNLWVSGPVNPDAMGVAESVATNCEFSAIAIMFASTVALALIPGTAWNRVGSLGFLRFFGRYSYGLYVWHYLFFLVTGQWFYGFRQLIHARFLADLIYFMSMLTLFAGVAVLSYWLVEVHFLRLKSKFKAAPVTSQRAVIIPEASSAQG